MSERLCVSYLHLVDVHFIGKEELVFLSHILLSECVFKVYLLENILLHLIQTFLFSLSILFSLYLYIIFLNNIFPIKIIKFLYLKKLGKKIQNFKKLGKKIDKIEKKS
jgi:hypothetical protein